MKQTTELQRVLMERDGLTAEEALDMMQEGKEEMLIELDYRGDAEEVFREFFGLEPDYIMDLF